ncbi:MAG: S49 family peptidase [Sulfuriflexus sp.]|nr:S49 family peptidase [Sulfuriflexus sp.]
MTENNKENWEKDTMKELVFASFKEQRRSRRWTLLFRGFIVVYLVALLVVFVNDEKSMSSELKAHTALIEVSGVISAESEASADNIVGALRKAFKNEKAAGIILRINSPGGSPVQSGYINDEIVRLRNKYPDKPLHAVIVDICASGGYYIAAAADNIYADKASLVGSIGVIMNGFGFTEAMSKLGVERRLLTAGEHKGFLDPFSPVNQEEVIHAKSMLADIHQQFINVVKNGRGDRLVDDEKLFSGYIWSGEKSLELGLIDGLGSSSYVAREIIGEEKLVDYTVRPTFIDRFADRLGASMGTVLANTVGLKSLQLR